MKKFSMYRALARTTLCGQWENMLFTSLLVAFTYGTLIGTPGILSELLGIETLDYEHFGGILVAVIYTVLLIIPLHFAYNCMFLTYVRKEAKNEFSPLILFRHLSLNWDTYVLTGLHYVVRLVLIAPLTAFIGTIYLWYAYSMTPYIISDYPGISASEALRMSRRMMRGHVWQLIVLKLTFTLWFCLGFIVAYIGLCVVVPFVRTAIAHFYEDVKFEYESRQANEMLAAQALR